MNTLNGPLRSTVVPVLEIDTTVACQSSYAKVFASGGSFQDVCGELIGVGQNRPVQRLPFSLIFFWGAFRMSLIIKDMKIAEKKSKLTKHSIQQTTDSEQPTKSAANQHRVHGVICNAIQCIVGERMDFLDQKTKTSD